MLSGSLCGFAELDVFGKTNSVGCSENAIEADLLRVGDGLEIVRRERWLTTGEQNNYLTSRFERDCAVQDRFGVFESRFVNIANLVCIHEARVAHHVAAVRQVD